MQIITVTVPPLLVSCLLVPRDVIRDLTPVTAEQEEYQSRDAPAILAAMVSVITQAANFLAHERASTSCLSLESAYGNSVRDMFAQHCCG